MKQALILSGGQGTRAKSRIGNKPKSLIEIDNKPILWYQLELLKKYNYTQVLILVNHLADQIIEYINSNQDWGINIKVIDEEDTCITKGGANLVIDPLSLQYLEGSTVDYTEDLMGSKFIISNPNATTTCGCGESFSI